MKRKSQDGLHVLLSDIFSADWVAMKEEILQREKETCSSTREEQFISKVLNYL